MDARTDFIKVDKTQYVVGRILPGSDLTQAIKQICEEGSITSGVIEMGIGSLSSANIVHAVEDRQEALGMSYSEPIKLEGPLELLSSQGIIGRNEEGELETHIHGLMIDKDSNIIGGHFLEEGNIILATLELSILVLDQEIIRSEDEETAFKLFKFKNL